MEYIKYAFTGINVLPSIILVIIMFYWVMTIFGFFSVDSFDIDLGVDVDFDLDLDIDLDVDVDTDLDLGADVDAGDVSLTMKILQFSNIGVIPFMVYLSIFDFILWALSLMTYYLNILPNSLWAILIFFGNVIITFFVTKLLTNPMVGFFKSMETKSDINLLGHLCVVKTEASEDRMGQAEVKNKDFPIVINVKSLKGVLKKGQRAIVISKDGSNNVYKIARDDYY